MYMSNFHPNLKREIRDSWDRLFDETSHITESRASVWEIRKEWIVNVIRA